MALSMAAATPANAVPGRSTSAPAELGGWGARPPGLVDESGRRGDRSPPHHTYSTSMEAAQTEGARRMDWQTWLAYITGSVDQELLLRNEDLVTEHRILRNQSTGRVRLTDGERMTLAEIGQKLGKQALKEVAKIVKLDTILAWPRTRAQGPRASHDRPGAGGLGRGRRRIAPGATTGLSEPWPTLGTPAVTRPWATS